MNELATESALCHVLSVAELTIGLAAEGAGHTLVPLLVAAVTHREVHVPPRALSTAWGSCSTVPTYSTILAFPAMLGHICYHWFNAVDVETLITGVARQKTRVVTRASARLARLAVGALPAHPGAGGDHYRGFQAKAMVMRPTQGAEQQLRQ